MAPRRRKQRPTAQQVARRLVVLKFVVEYAMAAPSRGVLEQLLEYWPNKERKEFFRNAERKRDTF
jgi:hypothetical protein